MHSTKISGLAVDTEYTFHLVLRTTAGTFSSERVAVRTHKMTDLSGITITTGILPAATRENLTSAVERIGAKIVDGVRIDTTHFVTTEGRGVAWEKAVENNIPVVRPEWVDACEKNGRILGVTKFYLDAQWTGPPAEESRPSIAAQAPAVTQKELPPTPTQNGGSAAENKDDESSAEPKEVAGKQGSDKDDESDDEEDADESEDQIKSAVHEEQKVNIDDREKQKVALRPASHQAKVQDEDEEDKAASDEKATTPGDNASFQDVAL